MNSHRLTVAASANSRLHADIMMVRLRRAGVDCRQISVFFPTHSMPNSVGCWLPVGRSAELRFGDETITRAGQLRRANVGEAHDDGREIADLLTDSGIDAMGAHILAEKLAQGHILLCVHAKHEEQAAATWDTFRQARSDTIITGRTAAAARRPREIHQIAPWVPVAA